MIGAMDFAMLPPEVTSWRMYAGAGPESLAIAAAAWGGLATTLTSAATSYRMVVTELTGGPWVGPSSMSMAAAAVPFVSWLHMTAAAAQHTASQLGSAVAAYEVAFAATVPPSEIEVNRTLSAALTATNLVGQNTPAIAALDAQYGDMWAKDAAAMYGYAGASAAATTLTPFASPAQNTDPGGTAAQAAAVSQTAASATGSGAQSILSQLTSAVPSALNQLSSGSLSGGVSQLLLDFFNSPPIQAFESLSENSLGLGILSYGVNFAVSGVLLTIAPPIAVAFNPLASALSAPAAAAAGSVSAPPAAGLGTALVGSSGAGPGMSAGLGEASAVGGLSVPQSWGTAPGIRLAARALPTTGLDGLPPAAAGLGGFYGGMPPMGPVASVVNAPRGDQGSRSGNRAKVVAGLGEEPSTYQHDPDRWVNTNRRVPDDDDDGDGAANERDELNQLRKTIADMTKQRDVLKRTAAVLIQESKLK